MFARLLPQRTAFFDFFDKHATITRKAAQALFDCISNNLDISTLSSIKILEHEADTITRQCAEALHKTFITPIDRDQIHLLITRMDDIIDNIDSASDCLIIYKIQNTSKDLIALASVLLQSVKALETGVIGLRQIKKSEEIHKATAEIKVLEEEADTLLLGAIGRLFDEEPDARQIIKWKEIYESIEAATDRCADAADVLEGILLEND